jgi:TolB-like protein/class 3 adenylate cyclase
MTTQESKRKLTAILSADVKGYSRLMSQDEEATVKTLKQNRLTISGLVSEHRGRVVDSPGDNILAEFGSVVDALKCALKIQETLKDKNAELPENRRMEFRIGVNLGDVIEDEERVYGDGVNIAARLEGLAEAGGICVSGTAFDQVKNKVSVGYQYLGKQTVKNIPDPVRAYNVLMEPEAAGKVIGEKEPKQRIWGWKAVAAVAVLVLVAGGLVWNFYFRHPLIEPASKEKMAFPLPDKPSIAVLPFVNMSGSQDQEFFCDGVTDQIITSLSKIPQLFVIASNSTFVYKGKPVKVQQVAEDLGVRYVLEGSIQKAGERIRIRAQLIDAIDGRHMWAESYDRGVEDVFAIQDEIAGNIITSLQVQLTGGEYARAMGKGTKNLEALEMFWQAHHHLLRFTKEDNLLCRRYSEKAIEIDPKYPSAWAELGFSHNHDSLYGWSSSREQSMKLAEECAQKALSLNSSEPKALILLSQISVNKKEFDKALEYAERAVEANPNDQWAFFFLGTALRILGRHEEAIVNARKAIRLTPYYPAAPLLVLGYCSFLLRKYDDALSAGEELLARSRKGQAPNWWGYVLMIAIHSELGEEEKARQYGAEILNADPNWNLQIWKITMPSKNQSDMDRILDAARKAGLK